MPQSARRSHAAILERYASDLPNGLAANSWSDGFSDDIDRPHFLYVDGLSSISLQAAKLADEIQDCAGGVPRNVFSYLYPGLHYGRYDTWSPLAEQWHLFDDHILSGTCFVPVGYSNGANVAIVGAANNIANPTLRIPCVILIAPAHDPSSEFLSGYKEYLATDKKDLPDSVPGVVAELCGADDRQRQRIVDAYQKLSSADVPVHVFGSKDDTISNFVAFKKYKGINCAWHPLQTVTAERQEADDTLSPRMAVKVHLKVRAAQETKKRVGAQLKECLQ